MEKSAQSKKKSVVVTKEVQGFVFTTKRTVKDSTKVVDEKEHQLEDLQQENIQLHQSNKKQSNGGKMGGKSSMAAGMADGRDKQHNYSTTREAIPSKAKAAHSNNASNAGAAAGRRRSSIGMRGKRASTALNGMCPPPHSSISTSDYYTIIDAELSDPLRMRQLLVWCAIKSIEAQSPLPPNESKSSLDSIVNDAKQAALDGLTSKTLNTSWYQRPKSSDVASPIIPQIVHPNNIENAKRVLLFESQLKCLQMEQDKWIETVQLFQQSHASLLDRQSDSLPPPLEVVAAPTLKLQDPTIVELISNMVQTCSDADSLIEDCNENSLFKSHSLEQLIHQSSVASGDMSRSCEHLYSNMLKACIDREQKLIKKVDTINVLSLLSKAG